MKVLVAVYIVESEFDEGSGCCLKCSDTSKSRLEGGRELGEKVATTSARNKAEHYPPPQRGWSWVIFWVLLLFVALIISKFT